MPKAIPNSKSTTSVVQKPSSAVKKPDCVSKRSRAILDKLPTHRTLLDAPRLWKFVAEDPSVAADAKQKLFDYLKKTCEAHRKEIGFGTVFVKYSDVTKALIMAKAIKDKDSAAADGDETKCSGGGEVSKVFDPTSCYLYDDELKTNEFLQLAETRIGAVKEAMDTDVQELYFVEKDLDKLGALKDDVDGLIDAVRQGIRLTSIQQTLSLRSHYYVGKALTELFNIREGNWLEFVKEQFGKSNGWDQSHRTMFKFLHKYPKFLDTDVSFHQLYKRGKAIETFLEKKQREEMAQLWKQAPDWHDPSVLSYQCNADVSMGDA